MDVLNDNLYGHQVVKLDWLNVIYYRDSALFMAIG